MSSTEDESLIVHLCQRTRLETIHRASATALPVLCGHPPPLVSWQRRGNQAYGHRVFGIFLK
jgi:hypothetical protein